MTNPLLTPYTLGDISLKNRIVMPPMTRSRASQPGDVANDLMANYYAQRASAGLIISEGTQISPLGKGYAWTPGIYSDEQIQGWRKVTDAVHQQGGIMFAQLWHVGRVSHPDNTGGEQPISSSALTAQGVKVFIDKGNAQGEFIEAVKPRAVGKSEINTIIDQFAQATHNAIAAGFDGVELHSANGYLVNQFIDSESNNRSDEYGGSLANRLRFLDQVVSALISAVGKNKVGVRLAPLTTLNGTVDANPIETYTAAAKLLNKHQIAYMHIAEVDWDDAPDTPLSFKQALRNAFNGTIIYAGRYDSEKAQQAINDGLADLIAFGRPFVANPDLPYRIEHNLPLAKHNPDTLFGGSADGLINYPYHHSNPNQQSNLSHQRNLLVKANVAGTRLNNRIAMAPMTRSRSTQPGNIPNDIMAQYYAQRANAGLIISEGTPISPVARGYSLTPGIYSHAQIEGWKKVTNAVHNKGGKIFVQLWHVGRRGHASVGGSQPLAASSIKITDKVYGPIITNGINQYGMIETDTPKAMSQQDINDTINDFVQAAKNAMLAGFDGVEIHGAHGYLFENFMRIDSNQRTDQYGGNQQNRMRFLLQTIEAVCQAIGSHKVALRLSPFVNEGASEPDPEIVELTIKLAKQLAPFNLAYLHFSENISAHQPATDEFRAQIRANYPATIMVTGKQNQHSAQQLLDTSNVDLVGFGTPFISNPDLVARFCNNWPLAEFDPDARLTLYGGDEKGYSDYPIYSKVSDAN